MKKKICKFPRCNEVLPLKYRNVLCDKHRHTKGLCNCLDCKRSYRTTVTDSMTKRPTLSIAPWEEQNDTR